MGSSTGNETADITRYRKEINMKKMKNIKFKDFPKKRLTKKQNKVFKNHE